MPEKEGKPKSVATIADIWRGPGHPKHIHLLDNDFFGNPEWRERLAEVRDGGFKVCFNQGINVRILTNEIARELATINYRDDGFKTKRLYTAWDSLGDERIFFRGVDRLEAAGVPPCATPPGWPTCWWDTPPTRPGKTSSGASTR